MNSHWKTACAGIALLALAGAATADPKGTPPAGSHADHTGVPPDSSNRQSLPDADRGLDRADERASDEGIDNSRAREQQLEHAPDHDTTDHRDPHSLEDHGKGGKNTPH